MATLASAPARLAGSAVLSCQSDERLAALVRDGHDRAFEVLVDRYRKPLVRYCRRILPESRAEDAVQQTFINAHAALTRADEPDEVKPWLYTIAKNAALNMLRQNGWNYEEIPLDFDGVRRPDQVVEQRIELQDTVAAMNELPERQRTAIVMRELEGRSYAEIAAVLGGGDGAVRQLLNRARGSLRAAATALTPPPLLLRLATSMPGDGKSATRAAEVLGGLGAAGIAKAGATALVAGSLVIGAVRAPISSFVGDGAKTSDAPALASKAAASGLTGSSGTGSAGIFGNAGTLSRHAAAGSDTSGTSGDGAHRGAGGRTRSGDDRHSTVTPNGDDRSKSRDGSGSDGTHHSAGETPEYSTSTTPASDHPGSGKSGSPSPDETPSYSASAADPIAAAPEPPDPPEPVDSSAKRRDATPMPEDTAPPATP